MTSAEMTEQSSVPGWEALHYDRVRERTKPHVNRRIDKRTLDDVERLLDAGPEEIRRRIEELDREWDVDRALMANFAILGGLNAVWTFRRIRSGRPFLLTGALLASQFGFLLNHAARGWCPPLPVFRRLGFRTRKEIEEERRALLDLLERQESSYVVAVVTTD